MSAYPQNVTVTLGTTVYRIALRFNVVAGLWVMNVSDASSNPIANGIPLVTGSDLLAQLKYLGFTGAFVVTKDDGDPTPPGWEDLGTVGHLYWLNAA